MAADHHPITVIADDPNWAGAMAAALHGAGLGSVRVAGRDSSVDRVALAVVAVPVEDLDATMARIDEGTAILVVGPDDPELMIGLLESGALGYVTRAAGFEQLIEAAAQVLDGHAVVPPPLLGALLRRVIQRRRAGRADAERLETLTDRERQVFELAARGAGNDEIAADLFISPATARTHLQRVFKKLDVHSRAEAVAFAARSGLDTNRSGT